MFQTREEDAKATMMRLGYLNSLTTRQGLHMDQSTVALRFGERPTSSSDFLRWMVSGSKK